MKTCLSCLLEFHKGKGACHVGEKTISKEVKKVRRLPWLLENRDDEEGNLFVLG